MTCRVFIYTRVESDEGGGFVAGSSDIEIICLFLAMRFEKSNELKHPRDLFVL